MRPGVFWEALIAWQADKEADRRHVAEVIRGVGVRLFNIQLKKEDQIRDIRRFMAFPWDEEEEGEGAEIQRLDKLSLEDKAAEAKAFLERMNIKNK